MGAFMWLDLTPAGRCQFDDGHSRLSEDGLRDVRLDAGCACQSQER
jgi:hypothetical protein